MCHVSWIHPVKSGVLCVYVCLCGRGNQFHWLSVPAAVHHHSLICSVNSISCCQIVVASLVSCASSPCVDYQSLWIFIVVFTIWIVYCFLVPKHFDLHNDSLACPSTSLCHFATECLFPACVLYVYLTISNKCRLLAFVSKQFHLNMKHLIDPLKALKP